MAVLPRLVVALSAIVLLAGCGGGSAPPTGNAAQGALSSQRTPEQISFIIPTAASSGSSRRRNTLPSTTQSVVLTFAGPYGAALVPAVAPVTINTSTCTTVSTGLQCTATANLPNGSVVGSVAAYAAAGGTGALLALGTLTLNVTAGATASVTLSTASNYQMLSGEQFTATLSIDHVADTFTVNTTTNTGAPETLTGTIAPLANGDIKATVTNNGGSSGDPIGDVILLRELPNGAAIIEDSATVSPASPWDGSSSTGGAALGVAAPACATASAAFPISLVSISGNSFTAAGANASQALIVGTATLTSTTLVGGGTSYDINGNSQGATTSGTVTCSGNVYLPPVGSTSQPTIAFNNLGVIAGANNNGGESSPSVIGVMGFANPANVSIPAITGVSYDGFVVSSNVSGNPTVQPLTATPISNGLQLCPYTDILSNVPATGSNCLTMTFASQPYPGVLYGTISNGSVAVATVAQVSGKYAILGIADVGTGTTANGAGNLVLFQH
jgi:hypothetical protein